MAGKKDISSRSCIIVVTRRMTGSELLPEKNSISMTRSRRPNWASTALILLSPSRRRCLSLEERIRWSKTRVREFFLCLPRILRESIRRAASVYHHPRSRPLLSLPTCPSPRSSSSTTHRPRVMAQSPHSLHPRQLFLPFSSESYQYRTSEGSQHEACSSLSIGEGDNRETFEELQELRFFWGGSHRSLENPITRT